MSAPVAAVPTVATANSNSPSAPKVAAAAGQRVKTQGFNLPAHQSVVLPSGLRHETLIIPSSSMPVWGGFFTVDIREKNILLNNITLQYTTSALTGGTGYFTPAIFWASRIEITQNSNVIDTLFPGQQFLLNQMLFDDQDRLSTNNAGGNYASILQRQTLAATGSVNVLYANLLTYFDQAKLAILTDTHNIQLRIYLDTYANCMTTLTSSPISTILSCNAICKVTRLDGPSAMVRMNEMRLSPHHNIFHETHYMTTTIPINTTSTNIVMSALVGNVATLMFTLRSTTASAVNNYTFVPISSFSILDGASTNLVGGQSIPASLAANILNRDWCKSSYHSETLFGVAAAANSANFYMWSFSADPIGALQGGQVFSSRKLQGQEQLQITFATATTSAYQLDIYAMTEAIIEQSLTEVKKISL